MTADGGHGPASSLAHAFYVNESQAARDLGSDSVDRVTIFSVAALTFTMVIQVVALPTDGA